jgi:putative SOS response-associated peptidase YedK
MAPVAYDRWLGSSNEVANEDLADLFAPFPAEAMTYYPVSPRVNSVKNDDARLIDPVEDAAAPESATSHEPPPGSPEQDSLF